jgi:hypothetical protein
MRVRRVLDFLLARWVSFFRRVGFFQLRRTLPVWNSAPSAVPKWRLAAIALPAAIGKNGWERVNCPATEPENCAQITRERTSANGEEEKTASVKSIMGRHSQACSISEQGQTTTAFFLWFRR